MGRAVETRSLPHVMGRSSGMALERLVLFFPIGCDLSGVRVSYSAEHPMTFRPIIFMLALVSLPGGCSQQGETAGFPGELEFRGEQPLLPGLNVDTGWIPELSPASVRATVTAGGAIVVVARATTNGSSLDPVAGSGELSVEGALALEVSARIDAAGFEYEGVVESFEYAIAPQATVFDPFALDQSVVVSAELPAQELGSVPIPSVPGATLVLEVTGGLIDTQFQGTCAEAAGGLGQYTGRTTMTGTIECASTIQLEIPLVGTETFGPFAFTVPVPELVTPMDLGTVSLTTGEVVADAGVCAGAGGTAGATSNGPAGTGAGPGGGTADTSGGGPTNSSGPMDTDTDSTSDDGTGVCGDGVINGAEVCDGADLAGEDCGSLGLERGMLACADDCSAFDTSACTAEQDGDCCTENGTPGCSDPTCSASVCMVDPFCCTDEWDAVCTGHANGSNGQGNECDICGAGCAQPLCQTGEAQSMCQGMNACVDAICAVDGVCCSGTWDQPCVDQVATVCGLTCP